MPTTTPLDPWCVERYGHDYAAAYAAERTAWRHLVRTSPTAPDVERTAAHAAWDTAHRHLVTVPTTTTGAYVVTAADVELAHGADVPVVVVAPTVGRVVSCPCGIDVTAGTTCDHGATVPAVRHQVAHA